MKAKSVRTDWHTADIIASLRKRGTTLAAVSRAAGLSSSTLANVLCRPWPKGEKIIADTLEVHPSVIWPSRYFDAQGKQQIKVLRVSRVKLSDTIKPSR